MTDINKLSIRGLVDSDFENPLRRFSGIFAGCVTSPATGYAGVRVEFNFKDIDNVVTAKGFVYNFPTAVINVGQSNKHKSRYGYIADSWAALIPDNEDLEDCIGKVMTLVFCDGQDGRPAPKPIWNREADPVEFPDKIVPTSVWIVEDIEGTGKTDGTGNVEQTAGDWAEQNLVGKTRAEFNKWAFADAKVRKDVPLQRSISDKSFINALVQLGRVMENGDGVFLQKG